MKSILLVTGFFALVTAVRYLSIKTHKTDTSKSKTIYRYGRKDYVMTKREHDFFDILNAAVGRDYYVFPQANLSVIFDEQKVTGQDWKMARRHINQKSVDYLLCDKTYVKPLLAIELDDSTHAAKDRQERDLEVERLFKGADMPLLRLVDNKIEISELQKLIAESI